MNVTQIKSIITNLYQQTVGNAELETLDTKSIVDIGKEILDNTDVENYVKTLTDVIGKTVFNDRVYSVSVPSIIRDSWEFGSILRKIDVEIPDTNIEENASFKLTQGTSISQDSVYLPSVNVTLFNKKTTFEIDITITEHQAKSAFNSDTEFNAFVNSIYNAIQKTFTVHIENLIMSTINNMTAQTIDNSFPDVTDNDYSQKTDIKAVNLLKEYNDKNQKTLTVANCLTDSDFLKFATSIINKYVDRLSKISTLFNCGKKSRFTPKTDINFVTLSDFKSAVSSYLQADTYNKELVSIPSSESVSYWQGVGSDYSFNNTSSIDVNIAVGTKTKNIKLSGILCIMFDKNALAICNENNRVTTHYNAKGEFFNNFYKFDCSYINDTNENYVVFFVA